MTVVLRCRVIARHCGDLAAKATEAGPARLVDTAEILSQSQQVTSPEHADSQLTKRWADPEPKECTDGGEADWLRTNPLYANDCAAALGQRSANSARPS